MRSRWITGVALATSLALLAPTTAIAQPAATPAQARGPQQAQGQGPDANNGRFATESSRLAAGLVEAVTDAGWETLVDHETRIGGVAQPIGALPNVDVAVIELDKDGHVVGAANVLLDRDKPDGFVVPIDSKTLAPRGVEFSQWREPRWNSQTAWDAGPAVDDILANPGADIEFMLPYPASVLKVMVAHGVLRSIDRGVTLNGVPLSPSTSFAGLSCGGAALAARTVEVWLDRMITFSDNNATCVMLQLLERTGQIEETNRHFVEDLGLTTFRMVPGNRELGATWLAAPARMTMGAMDTAKFMLLSSGSTRNLWRGPDNRPITQEVLSPESRAIFQRLLEDQGLHEVMSTGNLCGWDEATVPGIPALVPDRWIRASDGHAVIPGIGSFGFDVRPCNETAEVTFAHKTGLVRMAGNDAGIVRALPGEDGRWYVVALNASAGLRFSDPQFATQGNPCLGPPFICYPRPFPRMGAAIDQLVKDRPNNVR
jgi:hypothetical protein